MSSAAFAPSLGSQIPSLYQNLLPAEILNFRILEKKADCGNCSMSRENRGPRAKHTYRKDLKCCTFDPFMPNYLVGALLEDPRTTPAGLESLRKKMQSPTECLPIGLRAPSAFQHRFINRAEDEFGNREDWLCPYFDRKAQNCGVWRNRGNVCTSFYCFSDFGPKGIQMWEAFGSVLHYVEMAMMEEVLVQMDFSPRQTSELLEWIDPSVMGGKKPRAEITASEAKRLWNLYDNPEEFYRKSFKWVQSLKREDFQECLGDFGMDMIWDLYGQMKELEIKD